MVVDMAGKEYKVGQTVARAAKHFVKDGLHIKLVMVTKVEGDKVYIDGSRRAMNFPDRMLIV